MTEDQILLGFKQGIYSAAEVLAFYQGQGQAHAALPQADDTGLSEGQRGLWLLQELEPQSSAYHVPLCLRVQGALDNALLRQALQQICRAHPQLSSVVQVVDGQPRFAPAPALPEWQVEQRAQALPMDELNPDKLAPELLAQLRAFIRQPFALAQTCGVRALHIQFKQGTESTSLLLLVLHHLVFDGASVALLLQDLLQAYAALAAGQSCTLHSTSQQGFAAWEQEFLRSPQAEQQRRFWLQHLQLEPGTAAALPHFKLNLKLDLERVRPQTEDGPEAQTLRLRLEPELALGVRAFCRQHQVQAAVFFLAAWQVLLYRCSQQSDFLLAIPAMGRADPRWEQALGYFVNLLPLRTQLEPEQSTAQLLSRLKLHLAQALDHADYPLARLARDLGQAGRGEEWLAYGYAFQNKNLFQSGLQDGALPPVLAGHQFQFIEEIGQEGEFKLGLEVFEREQDYLLNLKYRCAAFAAEAVAQMGDSLQTLIAAMLHAPQQPVRQLPLLSAQCRRQVLHDWNATRRPFHDQATLVQIFEQACAHHPQRCALMFEENQLSYAQLNAWANRIAHGLRAQGVQRGMVVGLYARRSLEMVAAIYGILKAGAAYMPLEVDFPAERLAYMLENADCRFILRHGKQDCSAFAHQARVLDLSAQGEGEGGDGSTAWYAQAADSNLPAQSGARDLAYVIYTSGSTGKPKGVMIEHQAALNRIEWMQNAYALQETDVVLQKTPFSFDVSVWEFFWPLLYGARLVVARPDGHKDVDYLLHLIQARRVTTLHFVPPMLRQIVAQPGWGACRSLRQIFCSGEALASDLPALHYARNPALLHNLYGPTEAAVDVSYWAVPPGHQGQSVPIGKPIQNIRLYVLDQDLQLQMPGCLGQLFIAGVGLARGYINQPQLSAEKFIADPFCAEFGESDGRMYATGDLVRQRADGNLEFVARLDHQVKIRGFRIELGEIEACLAGHPKVGACSVIARQGKDGQQQLLAYLVWQGTEAEQGGLHTDLQEHLRAQLPEYMIPAAFVRLPALPLSANGKLDRKALPDPDLQAFARAAFAPARDAREQLLCRLWAQLLGFAEDKISIHDNFFALGGHSLLVPQLLSRLQEAGYACSLKQIFAAADLATLAAALHSQEQQWQAAPNLIAPGCTRLEPEMLPLVKLSTADLAQLAAQVAGGVGNIQDVYPLSAMQEGMLYHHLRHPQQDPYILQALLAFADLPALQAFVAALQQVLARHDALRTAVYAQALSQPVQVVWRAAKVRLQALELDAGADARATMQARLAQDAAIPLHQAPLLQLQYAQDGDGRCVLLFNLHHIIDDATSLGLLFSEILAHLQGREQALPAPAAYRDFIAWQQQEYGAQGTLLARAEEFFKRQLAPLHAPCIAFGLQAAQVLDGVEKVEKVEAARQAVAAATAQRVRHWAQELQLSAAAFWHLAWGMVLGAASGQSQVVFGTVLSGRMQAVPGIARMLGNFINTLPLCLDLSQADLVQAWRNCAQDLQSLLEFEQTPLGTALQANPLGTHTPLFNSIFNYRHLDRREDISDLRLAEHGIEVLLPVQERSNYPLTLSVDDLGTEFSLSVQVGAAANPACPRAAHLLDYLQCACVSLLQALEQRQRGGQGQIISPLQLTVVPPAMRDLQLQRWNILYEHESPFCLPDLFEQQAARYPHAPALECDGQVLSYAELNQAANRLAHHLRSLGLGAESRIALCMPRRLELMTGLLAILKAGAAYLPLEPDLPAERMAYILQDAQPALLLHAGELVLPPELAGQHLPMLDILQPLPLDRPGLALENPSRPDLQTQNLAYIIYTSGSTGTPKGVLIEHRQVTRLFAASRDWFHFDEHDVWTLFHSIAFDFSVWEMWGAWLHGGKLVLVPSLVARNPQGFYDLLCSSGVTVLSQTPSAFRQLIAQQGQDSASHRLRYVVFGGEALEAATLGNWWHLPQNRDTRLVNGYGITETAVFSTFQPISSRDAKRAGASPIGRRQSDIALYLLDARQQPVPLGAVGELYIGGAAVARGYLNRPDLNAERFVPDPFKGGTARMYRSGDLARFLADGTLEYFGRNDSQVKIRGFRIELGEIEARLAQHAQVADVRVVPYRLDLGQGEQDVRLVAYLVARKPCTGEEKLLQEIRLQEALHALLQQQLPPYMLPAAYVWLAALPLTSNGKFDQRALPAPDFALLQGEEVRAAESEAERLLVAIWAELLQIDADKLGLQSNFFACGGNSLLVTRLINRIGQRCGCELSVQQVFEAAHLQQMAQMLEAVQAAAAQSAAPVDSKADSQHSAALESLAAEEDLDKILASLALVENMSDEELDAWK